MIPIPILLGFLRKNTFPLLIVTLLFTVGIYVYTQHKRLEACKQDFINAQTAVNQAYVDAATQYIRDQQDRYKAALAIIETHYSAEQELRKNAERRLRELVQLRKDHPEVEEWADNPLPVNVNDWLHNNLPSYKDGSRPDLREPPPNTGLPVSQDTSTST